MLELSGVTLRRGGRPLIEGLSLALPDPGTYLLCGPAASGKTLLGRMLAGRLAPTSGKVTLYGASLYPERGLGLLRALAGPREAAPGPLLHVQLGTPEAGERVYDYLDVELWRCGAPETALQPYWEVLAPLLGHEPKRRTLDSLATAELALVQLALGAAAPARVVVLDGQLGALDSALLPVARRLLGLPTEDERYVVLTAPADFGELARAARLMLAGGLPVRVVKE